MISASALLVVYRVTFYLVQIQSHVRVFSVYIDIRKFPVSVNGFYPLRSTSNSASFPSFLTASYSCVILPFFYVVISCFSILGTARLLQVPAAVDA